MVNNFLLCRGTAQHTPTATLSLFVFLDDVGFSEHTHYFVVVVVSRTLNKCLKKIKKIFPHILCVLIFFFRFSFFKKNKNK